MEYPGISGRGEPGIGLDSRDPFGLAHGSTDLLLPRFRILGPCQRNIGHGSEPAGLAVKFDVQLGQVAQDETHLCLRFRLVGRKAEILAHVEQRLPAQAQFLPRQRRADTGVDTGTEGKMRPGLLAVELAAVSLLELRLVAIGRAVA